ncbi:hypothetical protein ALP32_200285 [Pseudomonas avellanae]|uniref:Uncharacterized protein n=1 Tax=Pseudomonas avellanae TaxID=46257 RepID=A0A3M5T283_9PSED|nr:hypothetical protein ALP32_200285 [Pseudomonas avellanae]
MDSLESISATLAAKTAYIQSAIRVASVALRKNYPILQRQSAIGAGILCFAPLGMTVSAVLYQSGHSQVCGRQMRSLPH